jgi:hypothetical protein
MVVQKQQRMGKGKVKDKDLMVVEGNGKRASTKINCSSHNNKGSCFDSLQNDILDVEIIGSTINAEVNEPMNDLNGEIEKGMTVEKYGYNNRTINETRKIASDLKGESETSLSQHAIITVNQERSVKTASLIVREIESIKGKASGKTGISMRLTRETCELSGKK